MKRFIFSNLDNLLLYFATEILYKALVKYLCINLKRDNKNITQKNDKKDFFFKFLCIWFHDAQTYLRVINI